ncbi:hypothetical protein F2P81_025402 [Scophthalmus maximus]|uniref:Uncharacterized protein n=1 Tax=Scophthalmus maximus TaxID=52904 RepID=A0A6A4RQ34_SCOMX|nr:hypothetical protein F2P81_025402 [Scophthalmus maximus]
MTLLVKLVSFVSPPGVMTSFAFNPASAGSSFKLIAWILLGYASSAVRPTKTDMRIGQATSKTENSKQEMKP